jgi:multidrug efflux pump subunit AcrA (membrane-fusion protein)
LHQVRYEKLQLTITERGQLEAAENSDIVCRVKARSQNSTVATTIRWLVDNGQPVRRGDKLMELDDSGLADQLAKQKIVVDQRRADWVTAEKNYEIVESQNRSDIATAKLNLELAEIDLKKYKEGDYIAKIEEIEGQVMMARSDLAMWEERASWSSRMSKPGRRYVTSTQAQADAARLKSAQIALSKVLEDKRVQEKFTGPREVKNYQGKIDEAKRALERTNAQASAKEVTADSDRKAKRSVFVQEEAQYRDIEQEIRKCTIYAPQSGLVVYYVPEQARWGAGQQQSIVAQGESVREGQKMMQIPDLSKMLVNTRVHEAMVALVHGEKWKKTGYMESLQATLLFGPNALSRATTMAGFATEREDIQERNRALDMKKVEEGQPAHVRVEAFPDHMMPAEVKSVATVASQQDFLSADVRVYQTMVLIKETLPGLKPGMSAEVTILTGTAKDHCLTVPIQSILGSVDMGKKRRIYVMTPDGPEQREVSIGLSNDKMAEVESGLSEGDQVIVNSRVLLTDKEKAAMGEGVYRPGGKDKDKGAPGKGKGGPGGGKGGPGGPPNGGNGGWPKGNGGGKGPGPA